MGEPIGAVVPRQQLPINLTSRGTADLDQPETSSAAVAGPAPPARATRTRRVGVSTVKGSVGHDPLSVDLDGEAAGKCRTTWRDRPGCPGTNPDRSATAKRRTQHRPDPLGAAVTRGVAGPHPPKTIGTPWTRHQPRAPSVQIFNVTILACSHSQSRRVHPRGERSLRGHSRGRTSSALKVSP